MSVQIAGPLNSRGPGLALGRENASGVQSMPIYRGKGLRPWPVFAQARFLWQTSLHWPMIFRKHMDHPFPSPRIGSGGTPWAEWRRSIAFSWDGQRPGFYGRGAFALTLRRAWSLRIFGSLLGLSHVGAHLWAAHIVGPEPSPPGPARAGQRHHGGSKQAR